MRTKQPLLQVQQGRIEQNLVTCNWINRAIVEPMVEAERPLEIPEIPEELREISVAPVPGVPSPRRRPSLAPSYIPADEDVLATLLGMWNCS